MLLLTRCLMFLCFSVFLPSSTWMALAFSSALIALAMPAAPWEHGRNRET